MRQDLQLQPTQYEALERDFHILLTELQGEQTLERFRQEYEKLHRALQTSHENEKRLIKKCKELNTEIQNNAKSIQDALKMAQEDSETIKALKVDVEKAWQMVDAAREKEENSKQIILSLKVEVSQLDKYVQQGAGITVNQENTINQLIEIRDSLLKERAALMATLENTQSDSASIVEKIKGLEADRVVLETDMKNLKDTLTQARNDMEREERRKKRLDGELTQAKKKHDEMQAEVDAKDKNIREMREGLEKAAKDQEEYRRETSRMQANKIHILEDCQKLQGEHVLQAEANANLKQQEADLKNVLEERKTRIVKLRQHIQELNRENSRVMKKNKQLQSSITEANLLKEASKQKVYSLSREIDATRRQAEEDRRGLDQLEVEQERIYSNVEDVEEETKEKTSGIQASGQEEEVLLDELSGKKQEAADTVKNIWSLEKMKVRFGIEASQENAKYFQCLEEVKLKNNLIAELRTKNLEMESKLKVQQNLYEGARSDRNLYSKNLIDSQDRISELRRCFKIYHQQIEQLKEEIEAKSSYLKNEQFAAGKLNRENQGLKLNKEKMEKRIQELDATKKNLRNELEKLKNVILATDRDREDLKVQYERIINTRDLLGTQLIRRNDELALLYEKIKIQHSSLANGEVLYQERLTDIRLLKFKIEDLNREFVNANKKIAKIEKMKQEVFNLQTDLLEERNKVKALSEELESSHNGQRFRLLGGTDPEKSELMTQVQTLQKLLISKTEKVVESEVLIQEKQSLFEELEGVLAKQPGPEMAEKLSMFQQKLKSATRQMKMMASELNMYQAQVNEYKYSIKKLTSDLEETKHRYYQKKTAERID